jgi:threonine dehydrogenase-like Zn-dependent dehydrogenase
VTRAPIAPRVGRGASREEKDMKATCWMGRNRVEVHEVPDPKILNATDAIVKISSTAICGSDLHLLDGYIPGMISGDILGHEFMGEVVEVGPQVKNVKVGDRVVVPFDIACGVCASCRNGLYSLCENSNPNGWIEEQAFGHPGAGAFGYSHLTGGYAGGQAEFARVPFADIGPMKVPDGMTDEQALFLSDILPTGWMAAEHCAVEPGDVIAVWGCGPVGQFAIASALLMGAERVIAIDRFPYRLQMARDQSAAVETINYEAMPVLDTLREMTGGRGPDACIDAVGMEAHGTGPMYAFDRAMQATRLETGRPIALREAILACRGGGTVSVAGVYAGFIDMFPIGAVMNRALTIKSGQTHVQRYMRPLLEHIQNGDIDPTFIITHRLPLDEAPHGYDIFKHKLDGCEKVVLKP